MIVTVADRTIRNAQDFLNAEGQAPVGESVRVAYLRERREHGTSLLIQPTPELDGKVLDDPKFNCALGKNENLFVAFADVVAKFTIH